MWASNVSKDQPTGSRIRELWRSLIVANLRGTIAIGRIASENDRGFERTVALVAAAANPTAKLADGVATFECEGTMTVLVEPTKWDDGPAIKVRVMDQAKLNLTRTYITEYCADPSRRRPKDACK